MEKADERHPHLLDKFLEVPKQVPGMDGATDLVCKNQVVINLSVLRPFHGRVLSGPVFAECVHGVASQCKSLFAILGFGWDKTHPYACRPFKLALAAQDHWRRVNSPHRVAMVRGGLQFKNGLQVSNREVRGSDRTAEEEAYRIAA